MSTIAHVIGLDFGTDSVRTVIVNTQNGQIIATSVQYYLRWSEGKYCDPTRNQFRQHPLDYLESMEEGIQEALSQISKEIGDSIKGIAVDTTGSTPVAVNKSGTPLALYPEFKENPNAMFILWKDHTAVKEAEEINTLSKKWSIDYTKYEGGIYSSEWFWAKILHTLRVDDEVSKNAYSWVEHCDWIPFLLTGGKDIQEMKRSRCSAGHKAMWHPEFSGLPSEDYLIALDPKLKGLRDRLYKSTYTSDQSAGKLSSEWATKLGLPQDIEVAVGAFDAHMGAVGGQIEPYYLSKVMGTSTCDMLVAPAKEIEEQIVRGICGQVDGSIIPGMMGLEAGQSAFGDVYAWFKNLLAWPLENVIGKSQLIEGRLKSQLLEEALDHLIPELTKAAKKIPVGVSGIIALDWLNGRRTPDANQLLKGAIMGLNLGSDAPRVFRALVEATCYGAKQIVDRFIEEGIPIKGIIGLGGVAKKSPFIMQTMADILDMPIKIAKSEQTCALGAAMFAATAAGIYPNVESAMNTMGAGFDQIYEPQAENVKVYQKLYTDYQNFGKRVEDFTTNKT